ncbi:MAG TPA: glucoamylase family protein [Pseudolabrys sp.]|nr:glucoamylase family protein [Pseudolabrys sp.]
MRRVADTGRGPWPRRREFLRGALGALAATIIPGAEPTTAASLGLIDDVAARTFRYFWQTTNPANGLAPDRFPSPSAASIAAVGFALTALPIGIERGFVSRAQARQRALTTLRFLHKAPQGPTPRGMSGYKGFFYHYLDVKTGTRTGDAELSTIDTALLLMGVLLCASYFDGQEADEREIRARADAIYARVDWRWAQPRAPSIVLGWSPEAGFLPYDWRGYCEAMLVYLLALGSPTYPVSREAWAVWTSTYDKSWGTYFGERHLAFSSLFGHFYAQVWLDFREIKDSFMRAHGLDYFENTRRAVYAQRKYAVANPQRWRGYGADVWGISACDGPVQAELDYDGQRRLFRPYWARGAAGPWPFDDGTLTPSVVVAAVAFAPEVAKRALIEQYRRYGAHIYADYGFVDSFNPSFHYDVPLVAGRRIAGFGWADTDYLGIDQGLALAMLENHRSQLIWRTMRRNKHLRRGLARAGFTGGWLDGES